MLRGSRKQQAVIAILALLGIAWGVVTILRHGRIDPEKKAAAMHQRSGAVMAELIAQAVGGSGRILLITPDMTGMGLADKQRWMSSLLEAFQRSLAPGLVVAERETAVLRPARGTGRMAAGATFTLETYLELLKRHPGVQGVVSFAGEPIGNADAAPLEETPHPPLVCFCFLGNQVPALMKKGVVTAAVVPRNTPTPFRQVRGDWFDIMYQVVTPKNIDAWVKP